MFKYIKIRTNILLHFLFVLLTLSISIIGTQYYFNQKLADKAVKEKFHQTGKKVAMAMKDKDKLSKEILYQIETHPAIDVATIEKLPSNTIHLFNATLKRYPNMYAIYLGYPNGDFFEVVNMQVNNEIQKHYHAPTRTRWMIIKIYNHPHKGRIREFIFFDKTLKKLGEKDEPSKYVVTVRPWYQEALASHTPVRSDPYLFSNFQVMGITYSKRLKVGDTVLALDFPLKNLHHILQTLKFAHTSSIHLFGRNGTIIASSEKNNKAFTKPLQRMLADKKIGSMQTFLVGDKQFYAMIMPLTQEMGKETYVGISIERNEILDPFMRTVYYSLFVAIGLLLLLLPLTFLFTDRIIKPIKALMLENEMINQRRFEDVKPIQSNIEEFIELSNSQISMSQSIRDYEIQQKELLDSFIKLIADSIDAKSTYTGTHCKKVPVIAMMLANAAQKCQEGNLADFRFKDTAQREAFERAAWLHDCGKITTPEYVIDKATKLETIYNRIHEIRTRFEVLWRDVEILYYARILKGEDEAKLHQWKQEEQERLRDDFTFVASCNIGSESLDPKKIQRLEKIAKHRWLRHFDNQLGLSSEELERCTQPSSSFPVSEALIADSTEHLIFRTDFDHEAYLNSGFTMEVPHYLYNRGELYNLSLQKGTLTAEERFKINEHIIMTIKMLESLPFPDSMHDIPQFAGEHHETMDGSGYPRGLTEKKLSIPSRIMAIADIFEALTAVDRPYKRAKTLSQALDIMYKMKEDRHIDANLFDLFLTSNVYMEYAKSYLDPKQIDEINIEKYLR